MRSSSSADLVDLPCTSIRAEPSVENVIRTGWGRLAKSRVHACNSGATMSNGVTIANAAVWRIDAPSGVVQVELPKLLMTAMKARFF